ncbi:hypothetical protein K1719_031715 [Acacia pycnantha]|nr:hypothetical protein K1719_031715 [Acacia pycnantha]
MLNSSISSFICPFPLCLKIKSRVPTKMVSFHVLSHQGQIPPSLICQFCTSYQGPPGGDQKRVKIPF